jgi:hypothetical protein
VREHIASRIRAALSRKPVMAETVEEKHYTAAELAELWHVDESTIRRMFSREPGVLRLKRALRIPKSVATRKYSENVIA